jgi:hypothetical protein
MTDLIEKLRSYNPTSGYSRVMREAADTIESFWQQLHDFALQINGLKKELSESQAIECTTILAASQAREKVLRESLNLLYSWANNWDSEFMNDPDWVNRDVEIVQRAAFLPTDDSTLTMLLVKEFSKGYSRGFANYEEGMKLALAAERERCAKECEGLKRGGDSMNPECWQAGVNRAFMSCAYAIRAIGEE